MDYIELNIPVRDAEQSEILTAVLADWQLETLLEEGGFLKALIPKEARYGCKSEGD